MFEMFKKKSNNKKNEIIEDGVEDIIVETDKEERRFDISVHGDFEEGYDKLGRPFLKKKYENGIETKVEKLKSGKTKYTLTRPDDEE